MKVLLTGAAGFIGSHTCEQLVAQGHQVVGYDSFDDYLYPAADKRRNVAELTECLNPADFSLIEANICDPEALRSALEGVDVVCHLAALAGVRPSLAEPAKYVRTNLEGTTILFEACREIGVNRIALASSSSVYGSRDGVQAFHEDDSCLRCASPYGATKRAGELLSQTFSDLYGLGISALRYFTVYGPRQRPDMAIHKFIRAAMTGEPVPFYGDGSSRRDYTYIDDIVSGTVGAIENVKAGSFNIYNLGGTETTSLAELVSLIERVIGRPIPFDRQGDQPGDVPHTYANIDRAHAAFGYQPTTRVEAGIERFWQWFQEAVVASPM